MHDFHSALYTIMFSFAEAPGDACSVKVQMDKLYVQFKEKQFEETDEGLLCPLSRNNNCSNDIVMQTTTAYEKAISEH